MNVRTLERVPKHIDIIGLIRINVIFNTLYPEGRDGRIFELRSFDLIHFYQDNCSLKMNQIIVYAEIGRRKVEHK